jgi:hypothetical protein
VAVTRLPGREVAVRARVADDADYERATTRAIPVVFLEPATG